MSNPNLNYEAVYEAAVIDGEHYERDEWNNIPGIHQDEYFDDAHRVIGVFVSVLKEKVRERVSETLADTYIKGPSGGTVTAEDFEPAWENDDFIEAIVEAVFNE